jgi:hypothetical protein
LISDNIAVHIVDAFQEKNMQAQTQATKLKEKL